MIIPILIVSSIFIAVAFIVTENNARYLLSGYNTMPEEERLKFDIKGYLTYFRNFHLFLGISLLLISLFLLYFVNPDWSGIFIGTYPLLAYMYFLWKGNRFSKEKNKKKNITTYIAMIVMLLLFVVIVYEFKKAFNDNEIIVNNNTLEITGIYGSEINIKDLKSIELIDRLPEITSKIHGFAFETIKKGYFKTVNGERIKLLINSENTPVILITTKDNKSIYYSSKDKSNEEIYINVKREISK